MNARAIAARVLYGASILLLVYVVYAHLASWRRGAEYRAEPVAIDFSSQSDLAARFAIDESAGLAHAVEGGAFHVRGTCEHAGSRVILRGAPTRLGAARARMRVRLRASAPVDVMAGVERAEEPARELRFGASIEGDHADARMVGDEAIHGARTAGDRELFRAPEVKLAIGGDEHEIALGLEPDLATATGFVDGMVVRSAPAIWEAGRLVRPTFSVTCRDPGGVVDVELAKISWEPLLRDAFTRDLDDRFDGPIFDTIWRVTRGEPDVVETTIALGHGLEFTAHAKQLVGLAPALTMTSPRFRAEAFHASLEADVGVLKESSLFIGVGNPYVATAFFRMMDLGVFEKDGRLVPFTSGHFAADGQAAFRTHEKTFGALPPASGGTLALELAFDPKTRRAHGTVNGVVVLDEPIAIQPYEDVMFHVGVNADGPQAETRLRIARVRFTREHPLP